MLYRRLNLIVVLGEGVGGKEEEERRGETRESGECCSQLGRRWLCGTFVGNAYISMLVVFI